MIIYNSTLILSLKICLKASLLAGTGIFMYFLFYTGIKDMLILPASLILSALGSLPAFGLLLLFIPLIRSFKNRVSDRITGLIFLLLIISAFYGLVAGIIWYNLFDEYRSIDSFFPVAFISFSAVFIAALISFVFTYTHIINYFLAYSFTKQTYMQSESQQQSFSKDSNSSSNKTWIKGLITGGLILLMLIPTAYVSNLVEERQARQEEVKNEVSSKWATAQTISFPYLFIPYRTIDTTLQGKSIIQWKHFIVLPEDLEVSGNVTTEQRKRSIYKVLIYNSDLFAKGHFMVHLPEDVATASVDWNGAKICLGISEYKGIEEKVTGIFNGNSYEFTAGLPVHDIDLTGLSAPVAVNTESIDKKIPFEMPLKIKGSDQLYFVPLAGNSHFVLSSDWNSPSFDGNTLPAERRLNNNGFEATWNFNKANLPFNTILKEFNFKKEDYSFGVSLLQPNDQYAKTLRCVKYSILFIGLTFSLFFIVEIMQKKPFHPVQYILVGMALIIFYTLLLSISEFLLFDISYLIAAAATVLLITFYAKSHFKSWKVAGIFASVIGLLYTFIFVLIRLEDTALLVGSIGLFIILALAMYASRKINWYGDSLPENAVI